MPYGLGLQAASTAFLSAGFATQFIVAVVGFLLIIFLTSTLPKNSSDEPEYIPGFSLFHNITFFRQRYDFLNWGFHATGQSIFQFKLLRNTVIVVSGEHARQNFFTAKGLDLNEGFKLLSGAIPMLPGVTSDLQGRRIATIHKRLANVQRSAALSSLLPYLIDDTRRIMCSWGHSGKFDPFENVYELTFQLTIRSLSCTEIAEDPALVSRLKVLYDKLDDGTTPFSVLLPWLPSPSMVKKMWATKEIYEIFVKMIHDRRVSGKCYDDALQLLLDSGDEDIVIIGFIIGLLIAGARATGTTASWLFTFLGGHQDWRLKAGAEVESLIQRYSFDSTKSLEGSQVSLSERLGTIPLEAWESEVPVLDAIIRETTRVAQPHVAMRRNLGPEMYIDNKIIPTDAYVIYPFSDVHLDPELYPDPWKFDPGRKQPNAPFAYVGWGAGNTTCLGTRLAKVELKVITAMFVLGFRPTVVDYSGTPTTNLPLPNWNDTFLCRPPAGSFYLEYDRTDVPL